MRSAGDIAIMCPARMLAKRIAAQGRSSTGTSITTTTHSTTTIDTAPDDALGGTAAVETKAWMYQFTLVPKYSMNYNLSKWPVGEYYGAFHELQPQQVATNGS
jgi:hypothetical protein